jgi:uncharacterized protein (DUF58 family)
MEHSELILGIQKLELWCKSSSGQKLGGMFRSTFKGKGMVLDTVRKYEIGDDIRDMNWNTTARFQEAYTNSFIEDKERLIWLLIDVSNSCAFGSAENNKHERSVQVAATIAYNALASKNTVGVIFFSDTITEVIHPVRGSGHFFNIARQLLLQKPCGNSTNMAMALQFFMKLNRKHSSVYLLSDFQCEGYEPYCKILAQRHELTAIRVYDERETSFPKAGWAKLQDAENRRVNWVNTSSVSFQEAYRGHQIAAAKNFKTFFTQNDVPSVSISTSENFMTGLLNFMQRLS